MSTTLPVTMLADQFGIKRDTVRKACYRGSLPHTVIKGRYHVELADFVWWYNNRHGRDGRPVTTGAGLEKHGSRKKESPGE